ncbi:bifunctional aspartate kinase/homoserine dehydrogenase I [Cellulophaga baltica]|uniref:bifunctional aspartate kinase/homoserine dehydrogenase I n=1 Tax=Cellulophaga TaxID=104264 RepID=UPI001C078142|nr:MULTISPECIES: bifunctional aspartate kinase/homoserine dehydrogenase I [Cellulophaga]MBU2995129.1 bifunctional aspartate kinase/homoserine dehydrogenase I [Cellulophaga baltica]MDO6766524.1 bifunctional aspartate kinase/homoserine dehydrogenase I [Cellulophaga sp. 1_MG-2023]
MLHHLKINNYTNYGGTTQDFKLSYQIFGPELHTAPIVLVNHALTGNSDVAGENGWWSALIGDGKCIDTQKYTILAFNVPGNGHDGFVIENYKDFVAQDIAKLFLLGLEELQISRLFALIGGSMGGGIAWEMIALKPNLTQHLIPVASDWKSTDWLIANCQIQEQFLINSKQPVHDARMHAMLCYRTPESFKERFKRSTNEELHVFNVESWLTHHGTKLQERFQLSAYKLMNQLLKTIDITRDNKDAFSQIEKSATNIHIIGVDSDLFFTAEENKDTFKQLAQVNSNVTYGEVRSLHGHDAFLIEFQQMEQLLKRVFDQNETSQRIKILKFGGKSLANGEGLQRVLNIITTKVNNGENIGVVLSARGKATDQLEVILKKAALGKKYTDDFEAFKTYQVNDFNIDLSKEFTELENLFSGVSLLGDYSTKIKDQVLAFGELISGKVTTKLLNDNGVKASLIDSRGLIKTDTNFGDAQVYEALSKENVLTAVSKLDANTIPVITGFIASSRDNETTTLGRNGSNYSASLIANFLDAAELQNYTHVDGIYTANPDYVADAKRIEELSYSEANELANFGATILHAKTIIPLIEKNIPLRILNTFNDDNNGTLISAKTSEEGIKSLSVIEDVALVNFEGRGLLGKVGVDARVFKALSANNISVNIISQGSSERGLGFVVDADKALKAKEVLLEEFTSDFATKDVNMITVSNDVSVISIVGQDLSSFHKPFNELIKNQIVPLLFNNTVTGKNVSLVVKRSDLYKALNVMHGQVFGISKKVNIAVFGHGNVGGTLIDQILASAESIEERKGIQLNVFAVANSRKVVLNKKGISKNWKAELDENGVEFNLDSIFDFAKQHHLENLIAVDNTASKTFVESYSRMIENGFDLVSSNKIANTLSFNFYQNLRAELEKSQKQYLYETNVGAGLPLIDTIKLLHLSGENITQIKGVFSGSLSYIFNTFSEVDRPFSSILTEAMKKGFTEPDAREDLSGNDVGRKLLILARELDLSNEFSDVDIQNLIPKTLHNVDVEEFKSKLETLDPIFDKIKEEQKPNHVLRYVGDLSGDLQKEKGNLEVKLISVPKESALGQVKGSDSIIEIYTESYGENPLVIQGAGAGAAVTARGVFGDILRVIEKN